MSRLLLSALALPTLALAGACQPAPAPPHNDNFGAATVLPTAPQGQVSGTTIGATYQTGEPASSASSTVWFRWTAPVSGAVSFLATAGLPMAVEPFTGSSFNQLRPVATDDTFRRAAFRTVAGTVYRIRVIGFAGSAFAMKWSTQVAPGNDRRTSAASISGSSGSLVGDSTAATTDSTDPAVEGSKAAATVWYRWTAPATGWYDVDTSGSSVSTALGVYTDQNPSRLVDDSAGVCDGLAFSSISTAGLAFSATAGSSYAIMVGVSNNADSAPTNLGGPVQLNWRPSTIVPVASGNDSFASAATIRGTYGSISGTTAGATAQVGEPTHDGMPARSSVWFSWTPPVTAEYALTAAPEDLEGCGASLAVYTGNSLSSLRAVASVNDNPGSISGLGSDVSVTEYGSNLDSSGTGMSVHLIAGTTYRISADRLGAPGPFTLRWDVPQAAPVIRSATSGDGSIGVIWLPPARTAGSPLVGYFVVALPEGDNYADSGEPQTLPANAAFTTIHGLHNGSSYRLIVAAVNASGPGAFAATRPVIPAKVR